MTAPCILVVDDDVEIAMMVAKVLRSAGYRVRVATNGTDAVARFEAELIDLLVTDKNMSTVSGLDLIATGGPTLPVILMTGDPAPPVEQIVIQGYLAKPFPRTRVVVAAVETALEFAAIARDDLRFGTPSRADRSVALRPRTFSPPRPWP